MQRTALLGEGPRGADGADSPKPRLDENTAVGPTVYVAGDIYRFSPNGSWEQARNVAVIATIAAGLFDRPVIKIIEPASLGIEMGGGLDATQAWLQLRSAAIDPNVEKALRSRLTGGVYLGFETPDNIWRIVSQVCARAMDFRIHPCRFGPELLLLAREHGVGLKGVVDEDATMRRLRFEAACQKLRHFSKSDEADGNDALLVLQVPTDGALLGASRFAALSDHEDRIRAIASDHRTLRVRPHPFCAPDLDAIRTLLPVENARLTGENTYAILSSGQVRSVIALSSSVLHEAEVFGLNTEALRPDLSHGMPVRAEYTTLSLSDLLGPVAAALGGMSSGGVTSIPLQHDSLRDLFQLGRTDPKAVELCPEPPPLPREKTSLSDPSLLHARGYGWSSPEDWGVWSIGPIAALNFTWPVGRTEPIHVLLEAHVYCAGAGGTDEVEFWAGGKCLKKAELPSSAERSNVVVLELQPPPAGLPLQINLIRTAPLRPCDVSDFEDTRLLGVGVLWIRALF